MWRIAAASDWLWRGTPRWNPRQGKKRGKKKKKGECTVRLYCVSVHLSAFCHLTRVISSGPGAPSPRHLLQWVERAQTMRQPGLKWAWFNGLGYCSWENLWGQWNGISPRDGTVASPLLFSVAGWVLYYIVVYRANKLPKMWRASMHVRLRRRSLPLWI